MDDQRSSIDRSLRDLTPDEVRRAFGAMDDDDGDALGTPAADLGVETSADVQASSGGNGSTD
jgi:hypothetical protein